MYDYQELSLARDEMKSQSEFYRPTAFWSEASSTITNEILSIGVECFRSLPGVLGFFVPTYGCPGSGYTVQQSDELIEWFSDKYPLAYKPQMALKIFLDGEMSALSDYRVLLASNEVAQIPHLHEFSESKVGQPIEQFEFDGRRFSRSSLNYLLGLAMLKKHLDGDVPSTVLEIGGGFGSLGEVLASANIENIRYIDVDIPPTSFVAQYYLSEVLGYENVATYEQTRHLTTIEIDSLPMASVLCSWQIEKIQGKVDLFVNFISFQEMEPHIVRNYVEHVIRLEARWILLRNIREGKQVRNDKDSVGVEIPILTNDYIGMLTGYELIERNVFPYGYLTVDGFHSELLLFRRAI